VLAGEISPLAWADATLPAGDSAVAETAGKLGAPLRRVSVGAAVASAAIVGASRPWTRAVCLAGCKEAVERGSVAGISAARADITGVLTRSMRLASADAASAAEVSPLSRDVGETAAADVATSGRAVLRGCRLGTGDGVAATAVGWASAGHSRRWGAAAASRETSRTGSLVARAIWGLVVARRSAAVVAGAISAGVVSREGDGASAATTCVRGVADG
jgi:hypothetical protein